VVEENLKTLRVEDWKEAIQDGNSWRRVVMAVKSVREWICP
jgi:hypothetical protein